MAVDVTSGIETKKESFFARRGTGMKIGFRACSAILVGMLVLVLAGCGGAGAALNKATVKEGELDTVVASYTYNGAKTDVTVRQVLEQGGMLDSSKNEDGEYAIPSAETILSYVRNQIIATAADAEGIQVTDDDLAKYAEEMLGSSDFESIATSYNMEQDTIKEVLRNSAKMNKLREAKVGKEDAGEAPEAPKAPEVKKDENAEGETDEKAQEDANNEMKKEYADYIIKLAGDEWDGKKGAFKSEDGPYATALAEYEVTKDGANYNAAQAAYYVAYQDYSTKQAEITNKWTDELNKLMGNASIVINTLKS
ncbi:MAG: hypothetical protein IKG21_11760 [Atopobiaceae bacterium]|nr:hypothetical protein [Atopobiaceae bacterium]